MKKRILIVDDEEDIRDILTFNLQAEGYEIETAASAEEALKKISQECDLIILDIMMGGMSGFKMAEKLRKDGNTIPIVFLTAKDTENDMLTGFSIGGDDYITKPFSLKEVSARIKAVIKRSSDKKSHSETNSLTIGNLIINFETKEISINGETVVLTKKEFDILAMLASNPSRVFTRNEIIDTVWKDDNTYVTERTVDVHITRLRKKMKESGMLISSRAGYGYRFNVV
ncbi:MAG: response regulator transcription factor [Culturomica sp.]|jgi:DNA-binding response OmpR family regulator|nr:response regulator transcription factor [Culturomica sp.]